MVRASALGVGIALVAVPSTSACDMLVEGGDAEASAILYQNDLCTAKS